MEMPSAVRFIELRKYLEGHGWILAKTNGSHHTFAKPGEYRPIVIPVHHAKVDFVYGKQAEKRCE
ncbi:MAG TPA: type II toxin-antitoxin system HicA family toxin [Humisphaera sp.]|nr:type II toxin-antitoxin system HicA family toxin [Humisphaera sp.]